MATSVFPSPPEHQTGETSVLPESPPHWIVYAVSGLLIGLFAAALLLAIVVPFPDIVRCPYVVTIKGGADPIQAPSFAIVQKVRVVEGQHIKAGDELFVLSSEEVRGWDTDLRTQNQDLAMRQADMLRDDDADVAEIAIKDRETAQIQDEVKFRQNYATTIRAFVDHLEKLSSSGAISQEELITHRLELATGEKDLSLAQKSLDQAALERQEMQTEHARKHADAVAEIEKIKVHLQALSGEMENTQNNLRTIRAPYDGMIVSMAERNEGSVVQNGQELCRIAPVGAVLHARLSLNESGMARLAIGQRVRFFAEAFPYQRYGTVTGRLDWLSPSTVTSPQGTDEFIAYATLDRPSFSVVGVPHLLQAGMKGEAHIIVGSRTLIEYAFEPIRQWREDARP